MQAIEVDHVSRIYQKYSARHRFQTFKSALVKGDLFRALRPDELVTALDDVTLSVEKGQTFGVMLGLTKKEISGKFDEIVEFAGLEDFIDAPVKTYSSGMYMRLGFAIAINVNPEILLIDEVLAVGDASFIPKCLDRHADFRVPHKTLLFVS